MRKSIWRISGGIFGYVIPKSHYQTENVLYLIDATNKSSVNSIKQILDVVPKEINFSGEQFNLRISSDLELFVKSPKLPNDEWYLIGNSLDDNTWLGSIISQLTSTNGEFSELFIPVFSTNPKEGVFFVTSKMNEHKLAIEETRRRIGVEMGKKTKSWTEGHRYDNLEKSIVYLGKFWSRKDTENSEFKKGSDMVEIYLYIEVDHLGIKEKTISEIFKNRTIGTNQGDIKIMYKQPGLFESGKFLENDFSGNIEDYWPDMIKTATHYIDEFGLRRWELPEKLLNIFQFYSTQKPIEYVCKMQLPEVNMMLEDLAFRQLLINWDLTDSPDRVVGKDISESDNIEHLKGRIFRGMIGDLNIYKVTYYKSLVSSLGIDLDQICKNLLQNWKVSTFDNTFENFLKHNLYFKSRHSAVRINQREKSIKHTHTVDLLSSAFSIDSDRLMEVIRKLVEIAVIEEGFGVSYFRTVNIGTTKSPLEFSEIRVDLENIISYFGSIDKIPDDVKKEILKDKFLSIYITLDRDVTTVK